MAAAGTREKQRSPRVLQARGRGTLVPAPPGCCLAWKGVVARRRAARPLVAHLRQPRLLLLAARSPRRVPMHSTGHGRARG